MKLLSNIFIAFSALLVLQLHCMKEQKDIAKPNMVNRMYSLKQIAYSALPQEDLDRLKTLDPSFIPEEAQVENAIQEVLQILKSDDEEKIKVELEQINETMRVKITDKFLSSLSQPMQISDESVKIDFIRRSIESANTKFLINLKIRLITASQSLKANLSKVKDAKLHQCLRDRLVYLDHRLDQCIKKLTLEISSLSQTETFPPFDSTLAETFENFILEQEKLNWKNFNIKFLMDNNLDADIFFQYLFAIHIPMKSFDDEERHASLSCLLMVRYIKKIFTACSPFLNVEKLVVFLSKTYPKTKDYLSLVCKNTTGLNTINTSAMFLNPKLFIIEHMQKCYFSRQLKTLIMLVGQNKVEKAAQHIELLSYEINDLNSVCELLQSAVAEILKMDTSNKLIILQRFVSCLPLFIDNIHLSQNKKADLFRKFSILLKPYNESEKAQEIKIMLEKALLN